MKVIITKDCQIGKINEVVEVSDGYAKNFLIPREMAIPYNKRNLILLEKKRVQDAQQLEAKNKDVMRVKSALEKITLSFSVKYNNGVFHNSVSRKQIVQELKKHNIQIDVHSIEKFKIALGLLNVKINLTKNIIAILKLEVNDGS